MGALLRALRRGSIYTDLSSRRRCPCLSTRVTTTSEGFTLLGLRGLDFIRQGANLLKESKLIGLTP